MRKDEVHVERIWITYDSLVKWCNKNPYVMSMLIAQKSGFGFPQYSEHHNIIIENYKRLKSEVKNPFGLHVHIAKRNLSLKTYEQQYKYLRYGKEMLENEAGIKEVKDFTAGWSHYNDITVKVCKDLGLTNFHYYRGNRPLQLEGMKYIEYKRFIHDYQMVDL